MRVLVDINHPAHVHLFKNLIRELERLDHQVKITSREKDLATVLLDAYGFEHEILSTKQDGIFGLAVEYGIRVRELYRIAKSFDPDVLIGLNPAITKVAALGGGTSIILDDTEPATLRRLLYRPLADFIVTPDCFEKDLGSKQIRYPSYQELAYLHPARFTPDPTVYEQLSTEPDDRQVLLRLISWTSSHDIGAGGISRLKEVVKTFADTGAELMISSEEPLPGELSRYQVSIDPTDVHDVMAYSDLYVGESPTMATESAVLGTPAVFISSSTRGYINELEETYGLVTQFTEETRTDRGLATAVTMLEDGIDARTSRDRLLEDKVDTTSLLLDIVRNRGGPGGEVE